MPSQGRKTEVRLAHAQKELQAPQKLHSTYLLIALEVGKGPVSISLVAVEIVLGGVTLVAKSAKEISPLIGPPTHVFRAGGSGG